MVEPLPDAPDQPHRRVPQSTGTYPAKEDSVTCVEIPEEAFTIARDGAAANGATLRDWLVQAIGTQAAAQQPVEDFPYDDCGFYTGPYSRV